MPAVPWPWASVISNLIGSTATHYDYDEGGHLLVESTSGSPSRDYLWLGDLPIGVIDTNGTGTDSTSVVSSVYADAQGTPRIIADASNKLVWQQTATTDRFAWAAPVTGSFTYNLRYPGQYFDQETGLYYNLNRNYDPATGRYIQSDPIGLDGGISTYAYVGNNPLSYIDPLGLSTTVVITYDHGIGSHASVYTTNGLDGGPFLYDPAGNYPGLNPNVDTRGSGDLFAGDDANLSSYLAWQRSTGSAVTTYTFDTTPAQEAAIEKAAEDLGGAAPFTCASHVSNAIHGIGPFKNIGHYYRPGGLGSALSDLPGVTIRNVP